MLKYGPTATDIISDPFGSEMPVDTIQRFLLSMELIEVATKENFMNICQYITRDGFGNEYSMLVVLESTRRDHTLCNTQAFIMWANKTAPFILLGR
jgi:hypothetical protein